MIIEDLKMLLYEYKTCKTFNVVDPKEKKQTSKRLKKLIKRLKKEKLKAENSTRV